MKINLRISIDKCVFFQKEIEFVGFNISNKGLQITSEKNDQITNYSEPTTAKELRRFLGVIGYYRHLIPNFAEIIVPFTNLIRNSQKSRNITFDEDATRSFAPIKEK